VYLALLVADSAWIYAAAGAACLIIGLGGAPLTWAAVVALLGAGMMTAWVLGGARGDRVSLAIAQGTAGLVAVYVTAGAQQFDDRGGIDLLWLPHAFGGGLDGEGALGLVLALLLALVLWLRAGGLVSGAPPAEQIQRTFRVGMAAVSAALIAELASGTDIGARLVLFPFFGASLAGMALGRLTDPAREGRTVTWVRLVGGSVGAILLAGLALGVLSGAYGSGALGLLSRAWYALADGLLWVARYPLKVIFAAIEALFNWLRSLFESEGEEIDLPAAGEIAPGMQEAAEEAVGSGILEVLVDILQYPVAVLLAVVVFLVLVRAYRRLRQGEPKEAADRESIKDDADPGEDLVGLLGRLLPGWLTRRRGTAAWRYPEGEPGITEVFILYFGYLSEAIRRGMHLDTRHTPNERREALERALPGAPVAELTRRFNAACYGRERSDGRTIAGLEQDLEQLKRGKPGNGPG